MSFKCKVVYLTIAIVLFVSVVILHKINIILHTIRYNKSDYILKNTITGDYVIVNDDIAYIVDDNTSKVYMLFIGKAVNKKYENYGVKIIELQHLDIINTPPR